MPGNAFALLLQGSCRARAGAESRGDRGVQGLPHAGAAERRRASLDGAGGPAPRRSASRARGRGSRACARPAAYQRHRPPRRAAVLVGPRRRRDRVAARRRLQQDPSNQRCASSSPTCWRTRSGFRKPRPSTGACSTERPARQPRADRPRRAAGCDQSTRSGARTADARARGRRPRRGGAPGAGAGVCAVGPRRSARADYERLARTATRPDIREAGQRGLRKGR